MSSSRMMHGELGSLVLSRICREPACCDLGRGAIDWRLRRAVHWWWRAVVWGFWRGCWWRAVEWGFRRGWWWRAVDWGLRRGWWWRAVVWRFWRGWWWRTVVWGFGRVTWGAVDWRFRRGWRSPARCCRRGLWAVCHHHHIPYHQNRHDDHYHDASCYGRRVHDRHHSHDHHTCHGRQRIQQ